jgi:hypothetical protein
MKTKKYTSVEVELIYLYTSDIVTASAGEFDDQKDNDVSGGDIFKD